jgi:hypothetical protein
VLVLVTVPTVSTRVEVVVIIWVVKIGFVATGTDAA